MEILVISWNYPPRRGGIEYLVSNLCRELRKRHSVFVITSYASPAPDEQGVFRAPWPGLIPFAIYALWRGARILSLNRNTTVVFGGSAMVAPLVLFLARVFRTRAALQTHGLDLIYSRALYQFLCVRWVKCCERVIANSNYTASLAKDKGSSEASVAVIAPGVWPDQFQSCDAADTSRRKFDLIGRRIILFVGRLARRKGVRQFIQHSLRRIAQKVPEACLVVVGDDPSESLTQRGAMIEEIETVIGATGLWNHVRLLRKLPDEEKISLYRACDVVVLPALMTENDVEGFGIVLLEAAAAGKPIVATRVGGIPDAVEDGKTGFLIEPGNYEALTDAILLLLTDGETQRAMGEAAKQRAERNFSWQKIAAQYEIELGIDCPKQN